MRFKDTECRCHPAVGQECLAVGRGIFFSGHDSQDRSIRQARRTLGKVFGAQSIFFTSGTTLANLLLLKHYLSEGGAVLTAHSGHLLTNDGSAPSVFLECKVIPVSVKQDGKITVEQLATTLQELRGAGAPYQSVPEIVSITQPTESGSVYQREELKALGQFCQRRGLRLHIDGARLAVAAAALNLPFRAFTQEVGVSLLSVGSRKAIGGFGTARLFFDDVDEMTVLRRMVKYRALNEDTWRIATSFTALFSNENAREAAAEANRMCSALADQLSLAGQSLYEPGSNVVWLRLTAGQRERLEDLGFRYSPRFHSLGDRFAMSWDTTSAELQQLVQLINQSQEVSNVFNLRNGPKIQNSRSVSTVSTCVGGECSDPDRSRYGAMIEAP